MRQSDVRSLLNKDYLIPCTKQNFILEYLYLKLLVSKLLLCQRQRCPALFSYVCSLQGQMRTIYTGLTM